MYFALLTASALSLAPPALRATQDYKEYHSGSPRHYRGNEYIKVTVRGVLRHNVVAIGSETTGTEIRARGTTLELDLGRSRTWRREAERLDGSTVMVTGYLSSRRGVEVPRRWIVQVTSLSAAGMPYARRPYPYSQRD